MHGFVWGQPRGKAIWGGFLQRAALQKPTVPRNKAPGADSAMLCPFQAVKGGVKGRCLPPPAVLLFLSASHPVLQRSSGAPWADSGMGMSLFLRSVSPYEASLQGLEEPSRRLSPGNTRLRWDGDGKRLSVHVGSGLGLVPLRAGATHEADGFNLTPGLL